VNSIHSACAAAFARHRGKTGTLHLLQEEIFRLEKAIESVSTAALMQLNYRHFKVPLMYDCSYTKFIKFMRNYCLSQILKVIMFQRFISYLNTVLNKNLQLSYLKSLNDL
jgi:hypothetical protein